MKPRVGFFDFASCEGCQLTVLNLENELLDLVELMEIVEFREISSAHGEELDIAFVEGSICRPEDVKRLRAIRARSRQLIALGACADTAGINALTSDRPVAELVREVYGDKGEAFLVAGRPRPLEAFVPVDGRVPGCPIDGGEFLTVLQALLIGRTPELPTFAVCAECKLRELPCTFERDVICLGPITRAGCNAHCIAEGDRCRGCRGMVDAPRSGPYYRILEEYGLSEEQIRDELRLYNLGGEAKK
ncbi:coenzyme F420-reducing hydrogenase gamma subunit [Geothermobacter ehrlichii]|uniref:Coenzyme F420-reducing hydrogenase gamma subunit n=1 Tax=Geothermobacter ehrlichii TaxID=213224 RepID=A0A5D3WHT0_9BACT|nr:NADH:ubiquinone oxidoreductase [Geothermobacter ehrlichii]TYO96627.1 coenzyme F420-reducing hydrogenase gamma subunit [Geothermobacter ehrlichii]